MNTVLVIDDSRDMRSIYRDLLRFLVPGINVIEAENGKDGISKARAHRPDLIFLDARMPVMNGDVAAVILRHTAETARIPLVAISSEQESAPLARRLRAVCEAFLQKPTTLEELEGVLSLMRLPPAAALPA